jgi:lysozyme
MKLSPLGLAILCFAEEFKSVGYLDQAGVPTAGYGHTGPDVKVGVRYTPLQGQVWLASDVARFERAVSSAVDIDLKQNQFDALVILCFNIGISAFSESTLVRDLNANDAQDAVIQFAVWDKVRGVEDAGLERRRAIEKALFLS